MFRILKYSFWFFPNALKKKLFPEYRTKLKIHSAGTLGINGSLASANAIAVAKEKGVDISKHISRGINDDILSEADVILVMADYHKQIIDSNFAQNQHKVFLLTNFGKTKDRQNNISVKDPICENLTFYRQVINQIDRELDRIIPELKIQIADKLEND